MSTKPCIKYTEKRGNYCTIKCQTKEGKESVIPNADKVIRCPFCGNNLLETGYSKGVTP